MTNVRLLMATLMAAFALTACGEKAAEAPKADAAKPAEQAPATAGQTAPAEQAPATAGQAAPAEQAPAAPK